MTLKQTTGKKNSEMVSSKRSLTAEKVTENSIEISTIEKKDDSQMSMSSKSGNSDN